MITKASAQRLIALALMVGAAGLAHAADPLQAILDSRSLQGAYNPVLLAFLTEEGKGRLPEAQRKAAIEQLVAGFKQHIQIKPAEQATAAVASLAGLFAGGAVGQGLREGAAQVWSEWVDSAFIVQKAGYEAEAMAFFENCLQSFPYEELRARCAIGLAAGEPDKAFSILKGLLDSKDADTAVKDMALRLLGEMAASEGFPREKKDAVVDELVKRTHGFATADSTFRAAIDGIARIRDPRAIEPLRGLTKGMLKTDEVKHAALRGLLLAYDDAGALEALQKAIKGGFMKEPKDQVWAALILIEGGKQPGFDWALQYLTKKKKGDVDFSDDLVGAVIARGGDQAKAVLAKAIEAQKPKDWLAAWMAIGLLQLGDDSRIDLVRSALQNKDWPYTRLQAAVALAGVKDYSGIPVLQSLAEPQARQGFLKAAAGLVVKGDKPDPDAVRARVADALAAIDQPDAAPVLRSLLADKSDRVRLSAAYGLSRMSDPAALDALQDALAADYGKEQGRSRNPEVHAHILRAAAARFPKEPRTAAVLKKGSESEIVSVKLLALAAAKGLSR